MKPEFWHDIWEKREIGFHNEAVNRFLEESFSKFELEKGERVFIPLCGKTLDSSWLLKQGFQVVGVELNEGAIIELFSEMGIKPVVEVKESFISYSFENIEIFVGDLFSLNRELLGNIDFIYDRAALSALPQSMRVNYAQFMKTVVGKKPMLLNVTEYDDSNFQGPPFSVSLDEVKNYYEELYEITFVDKMHLNKGAFPFKLFETSYILK